MGWIPARYGAAAVPVVTLVLLAGLAPCAGSAAAATAGVTISYPAGARAVSGPVVWKAGAKRPGVISRVDFLVDGTLRWTDRYPPFTFGGDGGRLDTRTLSNGTHTLKVTAHETGGAHGSARGAMTVRNAVRADTRPPAPPAGLRAANVSGTGFDVLWSASGDAFGYRVYLDGARAGDAPGPAWTFTGLACGGVHTVAVDAVDAAGNRSARASLGVATGTCPVAPTPPVIAPPPAPEPVPTPAPPPAAGASVFVSTAGSDAAPCSVAAPCASLDRAYRVASPGDVVEVAAGSYPSQTVNVDASKTSPADVIVRPAAGADVTFAYLKMYARHVEIRGVTFGSGWYIYPGAQDVTLRDTIAGGGTFITSANDVSIIGGEIRGADSIDGLQVKMAGSAYAEPTNLLIDGVLIHDITRVATPTAHTECIQFTAGRDVVIRNSRFVDCSTQGVFFKEGLGGEIDNVLVENSWFGKISGINTLIFDDYVSNVVARYNSFAQAPRLGSGVGTSNIVAYGNVGTMSGCGNGVGYRYNVWSGVTCGSTDLMAPPGFVDASGFDLRLAAGSAAIDRGDPAAHPATDMFGTARPLGGIPDAGAVERS